MSNSDGMWVTVGNRPRYNPRLNGVRSYNPDGSGPTELQRALSWWSQRTVFGRIHRSKETVRRNLILAAYRSVVAARQLHHRKANLGERLREFLLGKRGTTIFGNPVCAIPTGASPIDSGLLVDHETSPSAGTPDTASLEGDRPGAVEQTPAPGHPTPTGDASRAEATS